MSTQPISVQDNPIKFIENLPPEEIIKKVKEIVNNHLPDFQIDLLLKDGEFMEKVRENIIKAPVINDKTSPAFQAIFTIQKYEDSYTHTLQKSEIQIRQHREVAIAIMNDDIPKFYETLNLKNETNLEIIFQSVLPHLCTLLEYANLNRNEYPILKDLIQKFDGKLIEKMVENKGTLDPIIKSYIEKRGTNQIRHAYQDAETMIHSFYEMLFEKKDWKHLIKLKTYQLTWLNYLSIGRGYYASLHVAEGDSYTASKAQEFYKELSENEITIILGHIDKNYVSIFQKLFKLNKLPISFWSNESLLKKFMEIIIKDSAMFSNFVNQTTLDPGKLKFMVCDIFDKPIVEMSISHALCHKLNRENLQILLKKFPLTSEEEKTQLFKSAVPHFQIEVLKTLSKFHLKTPQEELSKNVDPNSESWFVLQLAKKEYQFQAEPKVTVEKEYKIKCDLDLKTPSLISQLQTQKFDFNHLIKDDRIEQLKADHVISLKQLKLDESTSCKILLLIDQTPIKKVEIKKTSTLTQPKEIPSTTSVKTFREKLTDLKNRYFNFFATCWNENLFLFLLTSFFSIGLFPLLYPIFSDKNPFKATNTAVTK